MYLVSFIPSTTWVTCSPLSVSSGSFDVLVFSLCPSSQNSYFPGCHDKRPGVRAKEGSPLKGQTKWWAVKFAHKDCKYLAEKVVLHLMLWPVAWICTFGQPENMFKHTSVIEVCSGGFVEVIKGKMGSRDEIQLQVKTLECLNIYD